MEGTQACVSVKESFFQHEHRYSKPLNGPHVTPERHNETEEDNIHALYIKSLLFSLVPRAEGHVQGPDWSV